MQIPPIAQDLLLVGGGHSHAIVLQMWAMQPLAGVRLTLVSDRTHTPYSGMLPGHVAGFYDYDTCHIDLRRLCVAAGAQFFLDRATGLDPEARQLFCAEHPALAFDWLSLDIGSTPSAAGVPGAAAYAVPAKPVPELLAAWDEFIRHAQRVPEQGVPGQRVPDQKAASQMTAGLSEPLSLGIVGGGVGGVELAIAMGARLKAIAPASGIQVHLFQRGPDLLPRQNPRVRQTLTQVLFEQNIQIHLNTTVHAITPAGQQNAGQQNAGQQNAGQRQPDEQRDERWDEQPDERGSSLRDAIVPVAVHYGQGVTVCDRLFWVTQASAPGWIAASGLTTDERGFVLISETLQSVSHPHILAAGDIATMTAHPRPKAGVFAVRQGRPLFENLRRLLQGQAPRPFRPQRDILALIGTGDGRAVASRGRWSLGPARLLWRWKDRIDRRFMQRFSDLPIGMSMAPAPTGRATGPAQPPQPPAPMYCSGCGSKVGKTSLERVLDRLRQDLSADLSANLSADPSAQNAQTPLLLGLDSPDDAAVLTMPSEIWGDRNGNLPSNRRLIQTIDYFQSLVSDPFIFGQITANHCLSDIFAMGAVPHSVLALVQVPRGSDSALEAQLYQVLSGALKILGQSQTALIGGHTIEGDTLAFGLSCNGFAQADQLWRKGGMQPGDRLILTKALGTGTLFAAEMQGHVKGRWMDGAIASMVQSNAIAVEILRHHGTTACTDITGFGLLGHLAEMVQASGHSVALEFSQLPWLDGAKTTLEHNHLSSLHRQNIRAASWIRDWPQPNPTQASQAQKSQTQKSQTQKSQTQKSQTQDPALNILFDPQTSGGLLAALPANQASACVAALRAAGFGHCGAIATVMETWPGEAGGKAAIALHL